MPRKLKAQLEQELALLSEALMDLERESLERERELLEKIVERDETIFALLRAEQREPGNP